MNRFKILFALSIGLNLAFFGVWLVHVLSTESGRPLGICRLNQPSPLFQKIRVRSEQWEQIFPLIEDFKEATRIQGRELSRLRCRLLDLMEALVLDENKIKDTREQLYTLNLELKKKAIDLLLKEKKILEPLQYKALIKEIRERSNCEKKKGNRGGSLMRVLSNTESVSAEQAQGPASNDHL